MAASLAKKRAIDAASRSKKSTKKRKIQQDYFSSSSSEGEQDGAFVARDVPRKAEGARSKKDIAMETTDGPTGANATVVISKAAEPDQNESKQNARSDESESHSGDSDVQPSDSGQASEDEAATDFSLDGDIAVSKVQRKTPKRHDPDIFANSMASILSSKVAASKREDPVLVRSKAAHSETKDLAESKLEAKARRTLREERRLAKEKGHVRDVLLGEPVDIVSRLGNPTDTVEGTQPSAAAVAEQERRLRKTAQRGVVKLFNAVRAAQVRSEEASRALREKGVVGQQKREEKIGEMGRQAFLDMVSGGGKTKQ